MKFVFRISAGGIKFQNSVDNSNTVGLNSITIRIEYLFAFQFWYC